ncbi:MAG: hypothetical protein QGG40_21920 [Myxococcota bacterium]|nr:hypothetical protein [Myxococcota bacterium]
MKGLESEIRELREAVQTLQSDLDLARQAQLEAEDELSRVPVPRRSRQDQELTAILAEHGLLTDDERMAFLHAASQPGSQPGFLAALGAVDTRRLNAYLLRQLQVTCADPDCPAPTSDIIVSVPKKRCPVCGGMDLEQHSRHLLDACLVRGLRHLTFVGGTSRHHDAIRVLLSHPRMVLRLVPGLTVRTDSQMRSDLRDCDVVLCWIGKFTSDATVAAYQSAAGLVLSIEGTSIAEALGAGAMALGRYDDA